ncbi:hypothetical protein HY251_16380 [bacterium]|nr:hypothetical protein [bacterium]
MAALEPLGEPGLRSRVAKVSLDGRAYAVKRYEYPTLYAARTLLRRSRARREFEALALLAPLVPAPVRPAAWGERRTLGLAFRSLVATEFLEDAQDLKSLRIDFHHGRKTGEERERLVRALPELARVVRRLHEAGFFAATLFEKNVLWRRDAPPAQAFSLIDLPFAEKRAAPLDPARAAYDLACLDKGARFVLRASERLSLYLAYKGSALDESDRSFLARVARERARREHATFFSSFLQKAKKRAKRTAAGKLATGRDPELRHRKQGSAGEV